MPSLRAYRARMKPQRIAVAAGGASVAAAAIVILRRRARLSQPTQRDERTRWRVVTIARSRDEIAPGGVLPPPLAAIADQVDVEFADAPGDRGTELRARLRSGGSLEPSDLRIALRQSKQLIEAGEIAVVDPHPHGRRKTTPQGVALDVIAAASKGKGIL